MVVALWHPVAIQRWGSSACSANTSPILMCLLPAYPHRASAEGPKGKPSLTTACCTAPGDTASKKVEMSHRAAAQVCPKAVAASMLHDLRIKCSTGLPPACAVSNSSASSASQDLKSLLAADMRRRHSDVKVAIVLTPPSSFREDAANTTHPLAR